MHHHFLVVLVYKGDAGEKGSGLFARRDIHYGEVVVKMTQPKYVHKSSVKNCGLKSWWATLRAAKRMEDDAVIWVQVYSNT